MFVSVRPLMLAALAALASTLSVRTRMESAEIRVEAGNHTRVGTLVRWKAPADADLEGDLFELVRADTGAVVAAQRDGDEIVWRLEEPLVAGHARTYELRRGASAAALSLKDWDARHLLFAHAGRKILRYNYGIVEPPEGIEPLFARSGYIHPLWTPAGRVVSNDFPPNHKHHHGIWFPWTNTTFEGRKVDFWNSAARQGRVEATGVDGRVTGPVFGGFTARHRFVDLTAPGGEKEVLREVWEVRTYASGTRYLVTDFLSVQECSTAEPLKLKEYRYGGFGFRGSSEWEGENVEFLTSEGRTRADGHATRARWCAIYGKVDGRAAGITFFCHPGNFRAPQNMRIHPSEPFFNWAPCQAGDFEIKAGTPYASRYRFVTYDGVPDVAEMERLWHDYAEPPKVTLVGAAGVGRARAPRVGPVPEPLRDSFGLAPFYRKYVDAGGLPVVASEKVSDYALLEAAYLVDQMLAHRPDVRGAMVEAKARVGVMAVTEFTTDIPEHSHMRPKDYRDRRARGMGGPLCVSAGEENLLSYEGDPYAAENILIHEFAHGMHHMGLRSVDPTFNQRLRATFRQAMDAGLWKGKYAATNAGEYWAEAVQSWFDTNRQNDGSHNHVDTREELKEYDPALARLVEEVFGDRPWRYTRPTARSEAGHLEGFDRSVAPRFSWPERLRGALRRRGPRREGAERPGRAERAEARDSSAER